MKTRKELKDIAIKLFQKEIFTSLQFHEGDLSLAPEVFMPLALMSPSAIKKLINSDVCLLYAEMRDATGRFINGYPVFRSLHYLTESEAATMLEYYTKIKSAMEGIE